MKVLLDECLPIDFRHHLPGHEVHTAEWAGFKGLKNGLLLESAEQAGYQVFITVDQGVPHQQNLGQRRLSVFGGQSSLLTQSQFQQPCSRTLNL